VAALLPALNPSVKPKIVKMTNVAGVESRPFDPDTYELEEEVVVDVDGRGAASHCASSSVCVCVVVCVCVCVCVCVRVCESPSHQPSTHL
jgi:hypothetical protein